MEEQNNVREISDDMMMDIKYLTGQRDTELERLNDFIKTYEPDERIKDALKRVLRINKQVKLMETVIVVSSLTGDKKIFNIEIGNIPEDEIDDYIKSVVEKFKKDIPLDDIKIPDADIFLPTKPDEDLT